ncbi:MAG: TrkH family potassium uptake protein [Bacteroidales bacterium]|jgi:trk system potassium uptake protein TrkH|nr:TrkH family potassium uptake protein [Bacteroidales bacterium]
MRSALNNRLVLHILSFLLIIEAVALFLSAALAAIYDFDQIDHFSLFKSNGGFWPLIMGASIAFFIGILGWHFTKSVNKSVSKKEGYLIVAFSWVVISFFGSLPFYFSGYFPSFTDAFFETISGFTTTGASILTDIESLPKGLLFWRSFTQWIGGMGIIVLSLAILPLLGIGGMQLFAAESPGPTFDKIHPKVKEIAKRLWGIYVLFTLLEVGLLMAGKMPFFDAICHSFATMATGGFSTQNDSIANYSSYIQYVVIFFMILAGTNFSLHFYLLNGKVKQVWKNEEFRFYLGIIFVATLIISLGLIYNLELNSEKAVRDSLFQVVSIATTTGFVTTDYLVWPSVFWLILFLLFFIGGSAGSTGGGVKVTRILLLIKNSLLELKRLVHPNAIIPVRLNAKPVPQNIVIVVISFFLIYISIFALGVVILAAMGLDFISAIGVSASSLGNIGPAFGSVGPIENYAHLPHIAKWFSSFLMLLGRLELFTILIIFSPTFWRK